MVSDAGPLIGLAKTARLDLLPRLFGHVCAPPAVHDELQVGAGRPGAVALAHAVGEGGWLRIVRPKTHATSTSLTLGAGEAEAIALALELDALLLIDERRGRNAARAAGLQVIGTGRVLIAAKERGYLGSVSEALAELASASYRLSAPLVDQLRQIAGED